MPEISVSINSARHGFGRLLIGNVVGSNIVNICFVFGFCILYSSWKGLVCIDFLPMITREDIKSLQFGLFSASIIPLSLIYVGFASRLIGLLLVCLFLWNTIQLIKKREGLKDEGALGGEKRNY